MGACELSAGSLGKFSVSDHRSVGAKKTDGVGFEPTVRY